MRATSAAFLTTIFFFRHGSIFGTLEAMCITVIVSQINFIVVGSQTRTRL